MQKKDKDEAESPCPLHGEVAMLASSKAEKVTSGGMQDKLVPFSLTRHKHGDRGSM